jgi:nucleotide-binding universal stress UspA family protein
MYQNILIPTDGSALSASAVRNAVAFAREAGARVVMLSVMQPYHVFAIDRTHIADIQETYFQEVEQRAARFLSEAAEVAEAAGVPCETVQVQNAHPYEAIIEVAEEKGCDLIAMASHGRRGVSALLLGSETVKVLTHSKLPVLVYR